MDREDSTEWQLTRSNYVCQSQIMFVKSGACLSNFDRLTLTFEKSCPSSISS